MHQSGGSGQGAGGTAGPDGEQTPNPDRPADGPTMPRPSASRRPSEAGRVASRPDRAGPGISPF